MLKRLLYHILALSALLSLPYLGQTQSGALSALLRNTEKQARALYEEGNVAASLPYLEEAVRKKPSQELWKMLGHARTSTGQAKAGLEAYLQAGGERQLASDSVHLFWYAQSLLGNGDMAKGKLMLSRYLRLKGQEEEARALLNENESERFYRDSIRYTVRPLNINTAYAEYAPGLFRRGLLYLSDQPRPSWGNYTYSNSEGESYDFYWTKLSGEVQFDKPESLPSPLNSSLHEGPFTLARSGKQLIYTRSQEDGQLVLMESKLQRGRWTKPRLVLQLEGAIAAHPSLNARGDTLYFVSDKAGGFGGTDIYYAVREKQGWSGPVNLGKEVNTSGNELFPNAQFPGRLYFASNGHFGLGGLDIYAYKFNSGKAARNLGAPVNSPGDDFGLVFDGSENWGFFSSNREGGKGGDDLYRLDQHIIRMRGFVYDSTNHKALEGAELVLMQGEERQETVKSKENGGYSFTIYPGEVYQLRLSHPEYRPGSVRIDTRQGMRFGVKQKNLALERKVKMYVMGSVREDRSNRMGEARVVIIDKGSLVSDTLQANARGGFTAELDAKSKYLFMAFCDSLAAVEHFSTPETGEASLSYYLTLKPKPFSRYTAEVDIIGFEWNKPCRATLVNKLTGQIQEFQLFSGNIEWQASSLAAYELCVEQNGRYASLYFDGGWKQGKRYASLFLKSFPAEKEVADQAKQEKTEKPVTETSPGRE